MDQVYKTVETSGALKIYGRVHAGEKPFSCDKCEKAFTIKCV